MRIDLNCAECGSNRFSLDKGNDDDANIRCEDCGRKIGTLAELKAKIAEEVMKRSSAPNSN